jgi:hypothetical protein
VRNNDPLPVRPFHVPMERRSLCRSEGGRVGVSGFDPRPVAPSALLGIHTLTENQGRNNDLPVTSHSSSPSEATSTGGTSRLCESHHLTALPATPKPAHASCGPPWRLHGLRGFIRL